MEGRFWALGFGVRVRGESSGMSRAGHGEVREWLGEREESDLNDVGPKTIGSGYTGQTGPARLTGGVLVLCFVV